MKVFFTMTDQGVLHPSESFSSPSLLYSKMSSAVLSAAKLCAQ